MTRATTAAAYARFSSDNQRAESIDAQFVDIEDYARREGYTIVARYADEAKSATTDRRPDFQRMIADAEEGLFSVILVFKLDRFSRDRYDFAFYRRQLKRSGVKIVSINESLSDDPESVILESVLEGMAEYYSRNLSREVMRKGMIPNAKRCQHNGGTPPLGYDIDAEKHYIVNPAEAETVRLIYEMYADGAGYGAIIDRLTAEGRKSKLGKTIGAPALYDILRNEKYNGTYTYNVQASKDADGRRNRRKKKPDDEIIRIPGGMPQIVSDGLWRRVQERLDNGHQHSNRAKRLYILSGKMICGECGSSMVGSCQYREKGSKPYTYYICSRRHSMRNCSSKSIPAPQIESLVVDRIYSAILSPEAVDKFADLMLDYMQSRKKDLPEQVSEYKRRLTDIQRQIDNATQAILDGLYSPDLKAKLRDLESAKKLYQSRLKAAEIASETVSATRREIINYLSSFGDIRAADPHAQAEAVSVFVDKITIRDDHADIDIIAPRADNTGAGGADANASAQQPLMRLRANFVKNCLRR